MKLKVGDIFTIPVSSDMVGFGQIVRIPNKSTLLIIVFDLRHNAGRSYDIKEVLNSRVLFMGYSLDAKLYHNYWRIIENSPVKNIELPYHKIGTPPSDIYITDYKGARLRVCSIDEFDKLEYQNVIAPICYENALKAYYGLQEWIKDGYDKILYEKTLNSVRVVKMSKIH